MARACEQRLKGQGGASARGSLGRPGVCPQVGSGRQQARAHVPLRAVDGAGRQRQRLVGSQVGYRFPATAASGADPASPRLSCLLHLCHRWTRLLLVPFVPKTDFCKQAGWKRDKRRDNPGGSARHSISAARDTCCTHCPFCRFSQPHDRQQLRRRPRRWATDARAARAVPALRAADQPGRVPGDRQRIVLRWRRLVEGPGARGCCGLPGGAALAVDLTLDAAVPMHACRVHEHRLPLHCPPGADSQSCTWRSSLNGERTHEVAFTLGEACSQHWHAQRGCMQAAAGVAAFAPARRHAGRRLFSGRPCGHPMHAWAACHANWAGPDCCRRAACRHQPPPHAERAGGQEAGVQHHIRAMGGSADRAPLPNGLFRGTW